MAKKKRAEVQTESVAEPTSRPVRLELPVRGHRLLRLIAADADMSMATYARDTVMRHLEEEAKKRGIKG
jgi:hypothetical protein